MIRKSSNNNLFNFTDKETSQDTFISWIINGFNNKEVIYEKDERNSKRSIYSN